MSPAALTSLNHNTDRNSISNQYPQPKTHQPRTDSYPVSSSLRTMDSKRKGLRSALRSFKEIIYRTDEWTKQLLRLKNWVISGNLEQWMEFRRLWWTVIAFMCSYLFQPYWFLLFAGALFVVFEKLLFLFLSVHDFEWEVKVHWQTLFKVILT